MIQDACPSSTRRSRQVPVGAAGFTHVLAKIEVLVRQCVGQLVNQSDFLKVLGSPRRQVKLFRSIVVERGGLFGEDVDVLFGQIEIFTDETKHLQGQLFGSNFFRGRLFFEPPFDQISNRFPRDDRSLDGTRQFEARHLAHLGEHFVDPGKEPLTFFGT